MNGVVARATMDKRTYVRKYFLEELIARSNGKCFYCQKKFFSKKEMTVDHIIPVSAGGKDTLANMILSCQKCNSTKGSKALGYMFRNRDELLQATKEYLNLSDFEFFVLRVMRKVKKLLQ